MELDDDFILILTMVFIGLIGLGYLGMFIYCMATYGNLPITEIPSWALWFMWGH